MSDSQLSVEQDQSVQDAKWLFAFVGFIGMLVFATGVAAAVLGA